MIKNFPKLSKYFPRIAKFFALFTTRYYLALFSALLVWISNKILFIALQIKELIKKDPNIIIVVLYLLRLLLYYFNKIFSKLIEFFSKYFYFISFFMVVLNSFMPVGSEQFAITLKHLNLYDIYNLIANYFNELFSSLLDSFLNIVDRTKKAFNILFDDPSNVITPDKNIKLPEPEPEPEPIRLMNELEDNSSEGYSTTTKVVLVIAGAALIYTGAIFTYAFLGWQDDFVLIPWKNIYFPPNDTVALAKSTQYSFINSGNYVYDHFKYLGNCIYNYFVTAPIDRTITPNSPASTASSDSTVRLLISSERRYTQEFVDAQKAVSQLDKYLPVDPNWVDNPFPISPKPIYPGETPDSGSSNV